MNTRCFPLLPGALALVISSQVSAAAPSHQCAQLWDDTLRLSCYDTAFGKPHPPAEPAAAATTAAPAAPAVAAAVAAPAMVAAAPQAASAPVSAAAPASTATAMPPPAAHTEKPKTPDSVKSVVTAVGQTLDGRFRVTLENGQIWQQVEIDAQLRVKVGDQVTVRKASLGSRQLVLPGGLVARVTLVK